ncbi:MAG: glycosyltransferase [Desulfobacteraceae bacterium]|jgi:predicted glycosyltransferase
MARNNTYNILMYSHDTYGLGHIRRTMAIAQHLRGPNINILILTGSPIAGRFRFPDKVDFVRIPGMIKKTNEEYRPLSIKINPRHALDIRRNIITATAKTFKPNFFIVDKEPFGLKKEVLPTLKWLKRSSPYTHTILGLRDVMDEAEVVRKDWTEKGVYAILKELYDEIWVYGNQELYNPVVEYDIEDAIARKMIFTGYIPRSIPDKKSVRHMRQEMGVTDDQQLAVVTTGGGGDGYPIIDTYLSMLENKCVKLSGKQLKSVLVTGPFMPQKEREKLFKRARMLGIKAFHFFKQMEKLQAAADIVVCMGGYNTICEILSQRTPCLVVPRETPRKEQLIRAKALYKRHLVEYLPWDELGPETMGQKVTSILNDPVPFRDAITGFPLTGIKSMCRRIQQIMSVNT